MSKNIPFNSDRKSLRLKGYDYSKNGLYFITFCSQNRACLFGEIIDQEMKLNDAGRMIESEWKKLRDRFSHIELHEFIIMPNHIHGIIEIKTPSKVVESALVVDSRDKKRQPQGVVATEKPKTLGDIIGAFKSITTVEYIRGVKSMQWNAFRKRLWERNYYEHIIRHPQIYYYIARYIVNNPKRW